jgi:hypothetical protein
MAFVEELIERAGGGTAVGVGASVAALVLAPRVGRPLGQGLRSLLKGTIRTYLVLAHRARTSVAEASLGWQRLYAEAQAEAGAAEAGGQDSPTTSGSKRRRTPASEESSAE